MKQWLKETLDDLNLVDDMALAQGFTRLSYTAEEDESIAVFKQKAEALGLVVREDEAGNVTARWVGSDSSLPAVASGSHLDTVINGGGYDGVAGVLTALGAIKQLKDEGFTPEHSLEVIVFRSEESARFGVSTVGSKAMTGLLDDSIGDVPDFENVTIKEAVQSCGYNWSDFSQAERDQNAFKSFVELHIEQGTQIEDNSYDVGVVNGIATPIRLKVKAQGKAGHTGTTPMDKRNDAFVAIAPLVPYVQAFTKQLNEEQKTPVVATVSTVDLSPNVMNVIPDTVEIGIDIRSVDDDLKKRVADAIRSYVAKLEETSTTQFEIEELVNNTSILLDKDLRESLVQLGKDLDLQPLVMDSGAGHDVMNMSTKWPSGLLFIPCRDGLSHHPDEYATLDDLEKGVQMLTAYYKNLSQSE
ncbi:M20 family metallo-hydrolase [Alkalibacillus sp. S2W]|uniref:M20 family metallo-hydrolase n=1 Tax=Alkalibacillus sp. S2W TaxID=3386553 RepID=UPI00398D4C0B